MCAPQLAGKSAQFREDVRSADSNCASKIPKPPQLGATFRRADGGQPGA
jgi:hypothetical protein